MLHDQIKLMCIAMHIMGILKMFTHLLLHTSLLSPHHTGTIISLCNEFHFVVVVGQKLVQSLAIETDVKSEMGINSKKRSCTAWLSSMYLSTSTSCVCVETSAWISLDGQIAN